MMLTSTTLPQPRPLTLDSRRLRIRLRAENPWTSPLKKAAEFGRKLREDLPVIGLISKLTTPTGVGLSHNLEFARGVYDTLNDDVNIACYELQNAYGEPGQLRFVLCILWMARGLFGTMPSKMIIQASARLRGTRDVEYEISQFEGTREEEKQKYPYGETVDYTSRNLIPTAVDGLVRLVLGVDAMEAIPRDTEEKLTTLILHVFPTTSIAEINDAFRKRADRAHLYA